MKLRALCLVLFVGLCARPVAAAPILSIEPSTSTVNEGDTFFLDINITGVTDLAAFQFDVLYDDPTVLNANESIEGAFLPRGGSTFFIPGAVITPGNLSFTGDTLFGTDSASGDGTLARVSFTALSGGSSSISIGNLLLFDPQGGEILADTQSARVDVSASATPVPEPTSVMLLGSGLVMAWRNRRRPARG